MYSSVVVTLKKVAQQLDEELKRLFLWLLAPWTVLILIVFRLSIYCAVGQTYHSCIRKLGTRRQLSLELWAL